MANNNDLQVLRDLTLGFKINAETQQIMLLTQHIAIYFILSLVHVKHGKQYIYIYIETNIIMMKLSAAVA